MPLSKREITDDEYVDHVRRALAQPMRYNWLFLLQMLIVLWILIYLGWQMAAAMQTPRSDGSAFQLGVILGIGFGLGAAIVLYHVFRYLRHWADVRSGFRTQRLLVQYYDRLHKLTAENQEKSVAAATTAAPPANPE